MRKFKVRRLLFIVVMGLAVTTIMLALHKDYQTRQGLEASTGVELEPYVIQDIQHLENITQEPSPVTLDPLEAVKQICFEPNKSVSLESLSDEDRILLQAIPRHTPTFYKSEAFNMIVCSVPKAGSTFWTRAMALLTGVYKKDEMRPIINQSRYDIHRKYDPMLKRDYGHLRNNFNGSKIITTRNPYSRLYSAYIDKIYLPSNLVLFTEIEQATENNNNRFCGKNVSFTDFLMYVIKGLNRFKNSHWEPISSLCSPCDHHKVELVKTENFVKDVEMKLAVMGIEEELVNEMLTYLSQENYEAVMGTLHMTLAKGFEFAVRYCLSRIEVLDRIWTGLQIQGYIKESAVFPLAKFLDNDTESRLKKQFKILVLNELQQNPLQLSERNEQQNKTLVDAYRTVPSAVIAKIRSLYGHDFVLFDYSMNPPQ